MERTALFVVYAKEFLLNTTRMEPRMGISARLIMMRNQPELIFVFMLITNYSAVENLAVFNYIPYVRKNGA